MDLTLQELLRLSHDTYLVLGWIEGAAPEMSTGVIDAGDIWLYFEIRGEVMTSQPTLKTVFDELFEKLKKIWGKAAKHIYFNDTDDEKNSSGYYVSIELAETVEG